MVSFVPVDHDPFQAPQPKLVPVDHDPFAEQGPPNLFQRFKGNVDESTKMARNPIEKGIFQAGDAGGLLNEVAGKAITAITPDFIEKPVRSAVKSVVNTVGTLPAFGGGTIGEGLPQELNQLAENHPYLAKYAGSAVNIGSVAGAGKILKSPNVAGPAINSAEKALVNTGKNAVKSVTTKTVRPTAADLKKYAQSGYKNAESLGGVAPASVTDDLINKASSFASKDKMVQASRGKSMADDLAEKWEPFRGETMTLERATELDQHLTDLLDDARATNKNGILNADGHQILEMKDTLRSSLEGAAQRGEFAGGPEGLRAYQAAVKDWSAMSQISEVERIVQRASTMDNPATALKTGFRNIANNPKRLNKFPKNVQKAIIHASKDGDLTNLLRTEVGSRLISSVVGGAIGSAAGPLGTAGGAMVGMASSRAARGAAEKMQMGRVNKVTDAIAQNSSLPTKKVARFGSKK